MKDDNRENKDTFPAQGKLEAERPSPDWTLDELGQYAKYHDDQCESLGRRCEVFLGVDGYVYSTGSVSAWAFQEPLRVLWHRRRDGKRPRQITIEQGGRSVVWQREALLVVAQACGRSLLLTNPEDYGLPVGSSYADLASLIDKR